MLMKEHSVKEYKRLEKIAEEQFYGKTIGTKDTEWGYDPVYENGKEPDPELGLWSMTRLCAEMLIHFHERLDKLKVEI